jgi:serine/threonine protein kinase
VKSSEFISHTNEVNSPPVIIGRGGTCELWRVMIHNKFHVLKQLKPEHVDSPIHIESLRREFETGFQLDHPNIIRYLKYDTDSESPAILLEFIDGTNLFEAINKQTIALPDESKKKIISQLCSAVDYLHSKQIYHLDLKPANLMITFRGKNLKLIDFGHSASDGDTSVMGGTKEFMPPEQLSNKFGVSNDVYAIGKIIEFLYSNEPEKILIKWIPIIKKCLAKDATERYDSVPDLLKVIEQKGKKNYTKSILFSSVLLIAITLVIYALVPDSPSKQTVKATDTNKPITPSVSSPTIDLKNNTKKVETKRESISSEVKDSYTSVDISYCSSLGKSIYTSFLVKYNQSDKSIKSGSQIQTAVTDSIQGAWFEYSSKFEPESKEYKQAYDNYFPNFTASQSKIMEYLYGSK